MLTTPDGQDHIVSIPAGHWNAMDFMILNQHTTLASLVDTAYQGWIIELTVYPETSFSTAFGFTIQESYVQFETHHLRFTNDNPT